MSTQAYYKDRLGFDPDEGGEGFLDPRLHGYEESLSKFKDERDAIQKKTFTKWVNKHLKKVSKRVDDLFEDLRDGHKLISLLEVLSRERLPRERGRMRFHMLQNVQTCLDYLRYRKIKLVNIRAEDIVDGNPKLILGLIWTIILHFQISDIMVGQEDSMTAREALLRWAQKTTAKYPGVRVGDFTNSWKDGLAFNAIIHRNRPDLVEWRTIRNRAIRERLDSAFNVLEKEYAVTRLLDPEDVDTPEPDEKSLITYISSVYDVFPEPPVIHPLYDPETQRKYNDYRELSRVLMSWIRHSIAVMQDRDFPPTLIEMKKLADESNRFRNEEVPSRLKEKQALFQMFKDIEQFLEETGEYLEPDLRPDSIERHWNQMLTLHQERKVAIQDEIVRLERLQRIAEKVHRDAKQVEVKLGNLEQQIEEEAQKIYRAHPADVKRNCDLINQEVDALDDVIKSMFGDVQMLKDGRHNQAAEMHKRVQRIHQRWLSLRTMFQSRLVSILSTLDESRMSRSTLESRLFETNEHFRHLRDCTEWVKSKLKVIEEAEYGTDLPGVQVELEEHVKEQKAIERFQPAIDKCSQGRNAFSGEDLQIYTTHLTYMLKLHSELLSNSSKRLSDLNILLDFMQSATNELIWLNEKEEIEVNRDWSAKGLDIQEIENYYEALMPELEKREIQFTAVQDRGESLLLQHHPASKTIEAYLAAMQTQWSWVLQLTLCLEIHLRQATIYQTFFAEIKECEQWVQQQDQLLNTTFSQSEFSLDEGERLLREMQILREDLARYGDMVQALVERSAIVPPLRLRKHAVRQPLAVEAICNYDSVSTSISKGEQCKLLDNVQKTKWRIVNSSGAEGLVPGVCFFIPPPDAEALDGAEKLKRQYDRCVALWQKKQLRMRQNMIFATIKVVRSWDLQQFLAMGKEQRDAIRKALNEDAGKLMSEGDPTDPQLKRLAKEMAEVNRLFDDFERRAAEGEGTVLNINEQLASLENVLDDADQTLQAKMAAPVPRDMDTLETLVIEHRVFETELQKIDGELNEIKVIFSQQPRKTTNTQQRIDSCSQTFDRVWQTSRIYIERLKCVEIVLNGLEEATTVVSEIEIKLAAYDKMPSTIDSLKKVHEDLADVQSSIQVQQPVIDQLNDDMQTTRRLVEKSRVGLQSARATLKRHPDVDRLEADVSQVTVRWANVCSQVAERLQSVEVAGELLDKYNVQAQNNREWLNGIEQQVVNGYAGELFNGAIERKQHIEDMNAAGGRLLREAKLAVEEKYRSCAENLTNLVSWLSNIEMQLANQECIHEEPSDVKNQINAVKNIRDDIGGHGRQIINFVEQARQMGSQSAELLSAEEIKTLDKDSRELKLRFEKADGQADKMHRKLGSALDELNKFRNEISAFQNWLSKAERGADDKEKLVCNLNRQQVATEVTRDFVSDIIAHQADLRFIGMAAQKFSEECKEYVVILNDYRLSLPQRLQPIEVEESLVCAEVNQVSSSFQNLMKRATKLQDKVANVALKQKEYHEAVQKAKMWLKDVENKTSKVLNEPLGADPRVVEDQLAKAKVLNSEFLNNEKLIENAKQATSNLLDIVEGDVTENERNSLESAPRDLESKYMKLAGGLQEKCKMLETALVQSQGVQEALDTLSGWLTNAENQMKNLTKPASLSSERLSEQLREQRLLSADISSRLPSFESVNSSASELISNPENARIARKIDTRMKELNSRFEKLQDKAGKRSVFLEEVSVSLEIYVKAQTKYEEWYAKIIETVESSSDPEVLATKVNEMSQERDEKQEEVDELLKAGKTLVAKKDVTDTQPIKDKLKTIDAQWKDLTDLIDENKRDGKARSEQLLAYERLKTQVCEWLTIIETKVEKLGPVALDADTVRKQIEEIKPIIKEHRDSGPLVDKLMEAGNAYDAMVRAERSDALRRRSSVTPLKRSSLTGSYSPIQSQLNDTVNRYTAVGTRLSDRQTELDLMKDEAKKHSEALKSLVSTLDRLEKQMPKDMHLPQSKDEADKLIKNIKNLLEDMYDKQPQLDSLKNQIAELVRRKPDTSGVPDLKENIDGISSRWKDLMDKMKIHAGLLEKSKEFQELCDHLNSWLLAKDKMMGVLGPVASDPRLVHNQLQQVQVLYDEFKEQERNIQNLDNLVDTLMESTNPNSSEARKIQDRVNGINLKWTDLIGRLEDRRKQLDAASGMSKQFSANLNQLLEAVQKIGDECDDLSIVKGDVEEALKHVDALEDRLEALRPLLAEVDAVGNELCHIISDTGSVADVTAKIQQVDKSYNRVQKKLDNKKAEIESQIKDTREFVDACQNIQDWIHDYDSVIKEKLEVSADRDTLKQQVTDFEPIYKEVMNKEHEVVMMLDKGQDLLQNSKRSDAKQQLKLLEKIRAEWEKVKSTTIEKKMRLEKAYEMCKKYYTTLESFFPWLEEVEVKIMQLEPAILKKQELEKQIRELVSSRNDISRHSAGYDGTKSLGESFLAICDIHKEGVKEDLGVVKQKWEGLNAAVQERSQILDDLLSRLGDFNDQLRDVDHSLQRCEDRLASHDALGDTGRDPKMLERMKAILEETKALDQKLVALDGTAQALVDGAHKHGSNARHVADQAEAIRGRYGDLRQQLEERCAALEVAFEAAAQFSELLKSVTVDLSSLEQEFDSMEAPARLLPVVQTQLDQVADFFARLQQYHDHLGETRRASEKLTKQGRDIQSSTDQIANMEKQILKLEERSKARNDELERVLGKLESFYGLLDQVLINIEDASKEEVKFKAVSADVNVIRQQQAEFKEFCEKQRNSLEETVLEANKTGQGLVQSAAPGVTTTKLEGDIENMNEKWNALKAKLFERERKLDVGLLQSGKFREALDSLAKWLSDTEEMVTNQKPPSADYKVVKAQLQEQKFLKKLLFDRQHSMSTLLDMGHDLASKLEPKEKKDLEEMMQELVARFDVLSQMADERMQALNTAMSVAKQFLDQLSPIMEWLDKNEKKIRDMEVVPTDEDKIQTRIEEHDLLHEEIVAKRPGFETLSDTASALMVLVGDKEASGLADKVADITDRYAGLVDASDNIGQLLADAKQGLRHLVLSYEDLVSWMEDIENRLSRYKVLSVYTEKLVEQMEEITELTEEVASHQQNVDNVIDTGLELMRHISNEEALQLKDKLDSIQRRYNELTSRASDLLKNTQETLPLVQQFHESHGRLNEWLIDAESRLQGLESAVTGGNLAVQEDEILSLETDLSDVRPYLESVNITGPQLCQRARGEGAATIEGLVQRDNRRFDAICEQIQRRGERLQLAKQRSMEVVGDLDDLLEWCRETESQLKEADRPSTDPDVIRVQLKEHKAVNEDIASQKSRVRDVLSAAKKVIREQNDDSGMIREKMDDLKETMDAVVTLSFDRLSILEQALPLAEHFYEAHTELNHWLDEAEQDIAMLEAPALRADQIMKQQEVNKQMTAAISEHKPLVDKLNKSGMALVKLCVEEEAIKVQDLMETDNARYSSLRATLRERQQALEEALQETSQFADKLDGMLAALASTADQIKLAEPVSAHPDKLQEQIAENAAIVEDLEKRETAFEAVKQAADDVFNKATTKNDPAVKDIKGKMDKLSKLWDNVVNATSERGRSLEEALSIAEKFWDELQNVLASLKDLQEALATQEPPAVEPNHIQQQQDVLQEIKSEIDHAKPEVEACKSTGLDLMIICGEQDKPEVKKQIEDLDVAWDNVTALFAKREENLIDAMEKAMEFHDTLRTLLDFLEKAENDFANMRPIGSDIDAVKEQIGELKDFKADVDPAMVKVESLNRQATELTERTSPDQAAALKEPLSRVNRRWEDLAKGIVDRQRNLEHALLRLGQFQHALAELMIWIQRTDGTLDELKPVFGDPAVIEVELAKLKVLVNDIQAHQNSVDTLNDAGRQLVEADRGSDDANRTQQKLTELNKSWTDLVEKSSCRQKELEDALKEAQMFHADVQDLLLWLSDVDSALTTSKPVGGLPETAAEQLQRFMTVYDELEENRPKVETILQQGSEYLKRSNEGAASSLQHNLKTLRQRWEMVMNRASDKKIKLEIALKEATEFHEQLQAFVNWLTESEKTLTGLKPVSRILETVTGQIEDHKTFQKDIGGQRETMLSLDKKGTHLKYFSQKQDVILIKNLLISVQHRWERVLTKAAERTRALDHGYKEAKEFSDAYTDLNNWLENAVKAFDETAHTLGKDPDKIKQLLQKHKEFQRSLGAKQPTYDATMRTGKLLKDRAPKTDEPVIKQLMTDLKNKWQDVCNRSVDRQRKLEEGLLFSGQFKDALQALLDWLCKVDLPLMKDGPVHGDLDTVIFLKEQHKNFEDEFNGRLSQANQVRKTATELLTSATPEDAASVQNKVKQLNDSWNKVSEAARARSDRLEDALTHAEELHRRVNMLLEWLSDGEMKLRFAGQLPDDQDECVDQIGDHKRFLEELNEKEHEKNDTLVLANDILSKCHPDAVSVIRHWITIIQSRWDEVSNWARQRDHRLEEHIKQLRNSAELLEELLSWLTKQENTLVDRDAEPLPDDIPTVEKLIEEHNQLMEDTAARTPEVDRVCKPKQQPKLSTTRKPSRKSITNLDRRSLSRETSPEYEMQSRKSSHKPSSRESTPGPVLPRKTSQAISDRSSPGRETSPLREYPKPWMTNAARLSPSRDGEELQHYGPRFQSIAASVGLLRKGSKPSITEPVIKNPRARQLWDKWRHVWVMAWDRQRRLNDRKSYLDDVEKVKHFSWDDWRRRFMRFMNGKKSRVTDLFRKMDKNNEGAIPREDFIEGIIRTKLPTSRLEMEAVANMFDRNAEGYIDWKEFMAALRPDWEEKPASDAEKIHDEVKRQVQKCTCRTKFRVHQVGEGKYRFGESQKLRLVRILRSTVMVRVGGGWVALDEFLVKNDPCRAHDILLELMPIFEHIRLQQDTFPCSYYGCVTSTLGRHSYAGVTIKEVTPRSFPMQQRAGRSSFSAARTPDSSTSDDGAFRLHSSARKGSAPVRSQVNGSQSSSRPASRNESRQNSRPPSRQNSNLSLDSTDDSVSRASGLRRTPSFQRGGRSSSSQARQATSTPISYNSLPRRSTTNRTRNTSGSSSGTPAVTPVGTPSSRSRLYKTASASNIPTLTGHTPNRNRAVSHAGLQNRPPFLLATNLTHRQRVTSSSSNIPVLLSTTPVRNRPSASTVSASSTPASASRSAQKLSMETPSSDRKASGLRKPSNYTPRK